MLNPGKMKNKLLSELAPGCDKFNAYRIERNRITGDGGLGGEDYVFQETLAYRKMEELQKEKEQDKERKKENLDPKHGHGISKYEETPIAVTIDPDHHPAIRPCKIITPCKDEPKKQSEPEVQETKNENQSEEDLTDLWNKLQTQPQLTESLNELKQEKEEENSSDSSCELTEEQLQIWMQNCQSNSEDLRGKGDEKEGKDMGTSQTQRHSNRSNCIYHAELEIEGQKRSSRFNQEKGKEEDEKEKGHEAEGEWGSWTDILKELQSIKLDPDSVANQPYNNEGLASLANTNEDHADNQEFVIIDTPFQFTERFEERPEINKKVEQRFHRQLQKTNKYGPWTYNTEIYQLYQNSKITLIQDLPEEKTESKGQKKSPFSREVYEASRPLRKINWEINEEKKPESRSLRSKKNCRMNLVQFGKDFFIFDYVRFVTSSIREGSHMYFGVKAFGNFNEENKKQQGNSILDENPESRELKQYLYLPSNGECLLQTSYQDPTTSSESLSESKIKKFNILLSLTKQKIAVCERTILDQHREKRQIIEVKLYDSFENSQAQYLAIIESKISNFSQQWYCDTLIHIPRRKVYSNKINQKVWQKFKIQLRLSQTGTIVAELGIFDAESSVTNCILFGENKLSQFMMGTLFEDCHEINYILRLAGISPVVGFAAAVARKIFVVSS